MCIFCVCVSCRSYTLDTNSLSIICIFICAPCFCRVATAIRHFMTDSWCICLIHLCKVVFLNFAPPPLLSRVTLTTGRGTFPGWTGLCPGWKSCALVDEVGQNEEETQKFLKAPLSKFRRPSCAPAAEKFAYRTLIVIYSNRFIKFVTINRASNSNSPCLIHKREHPRERNMCTVDQIIT